VIGVASIARGGCHAAENPNPWDKYNWAPGVDRTFVPQNWSKTCGGGGQPPGPSPGPPAVCPPGIVGGTVNEWTVPGKSVPQLTLACPAGKGTFTAVKFASFGRPTGTCGGFAVSPSCNAANTSAWVAALCVGKARCTLPPVTTIRDTHSPLVQALGDPCYGTAKWLYVELSGCDTAAVAAVPPSVAAEGAAPVPIPHTLNGTGDFIVFDFGQEVGGVTTLTFGATSDAAQQIDIAYSESTYYSCTGDASNGGSDDDSYLSTGPIAAGTNFTPPIAKLRGGFRYMILKLSTDGSVEVRMPSVLMVAAPNMPDPSAWANHFYSSDEVLNRVWYAAGWTTQLCSIGSKHGRQWPAPKVGWNNDAVCGVGEVVLVDGAKRDRVIWPGDMGVSVLTALATTGDVLASKNALITLYDNQQADGMLPYAGPPVNFKGSSDTYHLWALIGTCNVALLGNESAWASSVWSGFKLGVSNCLGRIDHATGLFTVVHNADWARGGQGGLNVAANALLYRVLIMGSELAKVLNDEATAGQYATAAAATKEAINTHLWDAPAASFRDNPTSTVHPQDGNSMICWFNVTTPERCTSALAVQRSQWNEFGSQTPEWDHNIGTFPGSMEVHARFANQDAASAHDLIRLQWGYMLGKPESTGSSFWEGYNKDGSFAYRGNYMSNAHGWATGPAAALTSYTLGIQRATVDEGPRRFVVAPQFGALRFCEGSLALVPGQPIVVRWNVTQSSTIVEIDSTAFSDSVGRLVLPVDAVREVRLVRVNGEVAWDAQGVRTAVAGGRLAVTRGEVSLESIEPRAGVSVVVVYRD